MEEFIFGVKLVENFNLNKRSNMNNFILCYIVKILRVVYYFLCYYNSGIIYEGGVCEYLNDFIVFYVFFFGGKYNFRRKL